MNQQDPLLGEFQAPDQAAWKQEVERLLKGAPFAKRMFTRTLEGITAGPLYDGRGPEVDAYPGQASRVRGRTAAGCHGAPWLVAQELCLPTVAEFNAALRHDLDRGQTAVHLILDQAGLNGLDPDQADAALVGRGGTSLASLDELATALEGVDLQKIPLLLEAGASALPLVAMLQALARRQGWDPARLSGCVGNDPVYGLAKNGQLPFALECHYDELTVLTRWAAAHAPGLMTLPVFEDPWHDAGADSALGLGLLLASAVHTLREVESRGVALETAAGHLKFNICLGTDFFMEMAKVRTLRRLWSRVVEAAGLPSECAQVQIHARTSRRTLTTLDAHVNMLRVTTEAMSGVLGGVDSLHVSPFDEMDSVPDAFSRRIARNVQLILAHECHFDQVQDPAGGSGCVESLTEDLAEAAWAVFQDIEAEGLVAGLQSGRIQDRVRAVADRRREALAVGKTVIVGSSRYANAAEPPRDPRQPDRAALQVQRARDLTAQRTSARHEDHLIVLGQLEKIMEADPDDLMERLTRAASGGATLGELTGVLRHDAERVLKIDPLPTVRDAEPFEALRAAVTAAGQADPARTRVFCACLGDFAAYMPRLDFVRGFFRTGGFEVLGEAWFAEPSAAIAAARDSAADIVVLVGLDTTYPLMAAPVAEGLAGRRLVLAGQPGDLEADLRAAGVEDFIHMRSNILDTLGRLACHAANEEGQS